MRAFHVPAFKPIPLPDYTDRERAARRHVVYLYLLDECMLPHDADPEARIIPSGVALWVIEGEIQEFFDHDLRFVPGFYYETDFRTGESRWRLNIPPAFTIAKAYTDERGRVTGVRLYKRLKDRNPGLLSSKGLPLGTPATQPAERSVAA